MQNCARRGAHLRLQIPFRRRENPLQLWGQEVPQDHELSMPSGYSRPTSESRTNRAIAVFPDRCGPQMTFRCSANGPNSTCCRGPWTSISIRSNNMIGSSVAIRSPNPRKNGPAIPVLAAAFPIPFLFLGETPPHSNAGYCRHSRRRRCFTERAKLRADVSPGAQAPDRTGLGRRLKAVLHAAAGRAATDRYLHCQPPEREPG